MNGKRPTKITVKLLADGQDTGKTLELSKPMAGQGNSRIEMQIKGGARLITQVVEVSSGSWLYN